MTVMIYLANEYDKDRFVSLKEISEKEDISLKYLEKIMLNFKDSDYFISSRGSDGGYKLAKAPENYILKDILEKLEGDMKVVSCLDSDVKCNKKENCLSLTLWKDINDLIDDYLTKKTLKDLIKR